MRSLRDATFLFPSILLLTVLVILNVAVVGIAPIEFWHLFVAVSLPILIVGLFLCFRHSKNVSHQFERLIPRADAIASGRLEILNRPEEGLPIELQNLVRAIDQIAQKQQQDIESMQRLERVRSEFLGNVSHELRTPIFAVQGFIETLLDGAIDDATVNRNFLERARIQSERLNSLLNDLIDISRIESGEMRMSFRLFDFLPFLREVISEMQPFAIAKSIKLGVNPMPADTGEVIVYGDKERLKQVLINLIDNAIKYTDKEGAVSVELLRGEPEASRATVRVCDTGIGIAQEHLSRLFERFYRVNKDRARSTPGGTGLGLAIVKHIVEAHRGNISVTSSVGEGSCFSFTLSTKPF